MINRSGRFIGGVVLIGLVLLSWNRAGAEVLSLAGTWRFQLNGPQPADSQGALPNLKLDDQIELPGTTETNHKGKASGPGWDGQLTRVFRFNGPAWYQRDVDVPAFWRGKRITLFLERTKYTQVWMDGKAVGAGNFFCTPQEFVLDALEPGRHQLTIVVDNTRLPIQTEAHQWSDNTQTNWNGIIGRIELQATDPVWLDDVQVFPNVQDRSAKVHIDIGNTSGSAGKGAVHVAVTGPGVTHASQDVDVTWTSAVGSVDLNIPLGATAALWDEFHPNLMSLSASLRGDGIADERKTTFGLRDFAASGPQFTINGRTTFLRGKHNACVFPLTGYPPMDVDGWLSYLRICQDYGINQNRCHTWVPPEAAFEAADELGMYFQPELPFWGDFDEQTKQVMEPEAKRILKFYGNHPSFVMFTMGNENRGSRAVIASLIENLRAVDGRHLYAQGSNAFAWDPVLPSGDDFLITQKAKNSPEAKALPVRGSYADIDAGDAHIQYGPAGTNVDYSKAIAGIARPVVGHEVGQWTVYPNFKEIDKYTGVTRARNFEHFRERLKSAGMLDQADDFFRASGALAAICYREDIEAALRTAHFGGFQLLDLQDFPGQGTALVGMLDAFMDSKGIISPEKWREFCSPVVLLARFDQSSWARSETFTAQIQAAHYGEADLPGAVLDWELTGPSGTVITSGKLPATDIKQGGLRAIGTISVSLSDSPAPAKLSLALSLENTSIKTSYPIWVYPDQVDVSAPPNVTVARTLDDAAEAALARGARVVLIADKRRPLLHTPGGGFATDFWCWPMFHNKPGTMGLLCDPSNPSLADFPTDFHSDWQWFDIALQSQPLVLDELPVGYRPDVQVIDNMERVHRLGLVFELKVGPGRLLICASDLLAMTDKPAPRQLLSSLLKYAASEQFNPQTPMSIDRLKELLWTTQTMDGVVSASSTEQSWRNFQPYRAVDGNEYTQWNAAERVPNQWWQIVFGEPKNLTGAEILWGEDKAGYRYLVKGSIDGSHWQTLSDQSGNIFAGGRHRLQFHGDGIRAVRIEITGLPPDIRASISEVRFF
jgi:F5/8 type C domain/Glycosyl hydrolases family 2, sugar binding domain/Glycosyl hydrolases family 2